jgi:hypothetical protein
MGDGGDDGADLTARQEQAIGALLCHATVRDAAAAIAVSESTLYRWLADSSFSHRYRAARRVLVEAAVGVLQAATAEAVATLRAALTSDRPGDRIKAALGIIDRSVRGVEIMDLLERVEALEARGNP